MKKSLKKCLGAVLLMAAGAGSCCFAAGKWNKKSQIDVISREDGSGTRGAFIEIFGIEKKNAEGKKIDCTTDEAAITNSTAVMLSSVAGDKYAIGYVSLGSLNNSVKPLQIDGAEASIENINNGKYKISRPFNIAVKDNLSDVASDFVNYILSDEGQNVIAANKYIKVKTSGKFQSKAPKGKAVVAGSSSVSPVMEKLIESYKKINSNAAIELQTSDSTTGVTNAINGTCDIGMASRGLKSSEKEKGVNEVTIAIDGIAVIVNKENPTVGLSKAQVETIFTGKVEKWSNISK